MGLGLKYVALIGMLMGSVVEAQVLNPLILPLNNSSHPFLVFDGRVPSNQVSMLANDLSRLATAVPPSFEPTLGAIFGSPIVDAQSMNAWLQARIKYVVGEDFDLSSEVVGRNYQPGQVKTEVFSELLGSPLPSATSATPASAPKSTTMMVNIGGAVYSIGLLQSTLLGVKLSDTSIVPMDSPRRGLLQIGAALFDPSALIRTDDPEALVNAFDRISTLFHEARHSDGHGDSLSFKHVVCGESSSYAGRKACDQANNGPYTIDSHLLLLMAKNCGSNCSASETEMVKLMALDYGSRVNADAIEFDARPERLVPNN